MILQVIGVTADRLNGVRAKSSGALFQVITQRHFKGSVTLTTDLGIAS
jgi:hypothetical protein